MKESERFAFEYQLYVFQRHEFNKHCLETSGVCLSLRLANQVVKQHTLRLYRGTTHVCIYANNYMCKSAIYNPIGLAFPRHQVAELQVKIVVFIVTASRASVLNRVETYNFSPTFTKLWFNLFLFNVVDNNGINFL